MFFKHLLVLGALLVSFTPASAAETYAIRGLSATLFSYETNGCMARTRFVILIEDDTHFGPNGSTSGKRLHFSENHYNMCTQVTVANLRGLRNLERNEYDLRNGYARVTTTLDMSDSVSGTSDLRPIDLTWIGDGERTKDRSHYREVTPGMMIVGRFLSFYEQAAVTGQIGTELIDTTGNIEFARYGEVTVETKP